MLQLPVRSYLTRPFPKRCANFGNERLNPVKPRLGGLARALALLLGARKAGRGGHGLALRPVALAAAKQSFARKGVPKRSLGNEEKTRWPLNPLSRSSHGNDETACQVPPNFALLAP